MDDDPLLNCTACDLHVHRQRVVPGVGPRDAHIMLVGEAPGAEEDKEGTPFVGKAGVRLNAILERAALPRWTLYLDNVVKCRPLSNDLRPFPQSIIRCPQLWLDPLIDEIRPEVIAALGGTAGSRYFPGKRAGEISTLHRVLPSGIIVVGSAHPSYALRSGGSWNRIDESILASLRRAKEVVDGRHS